MLSQLLFDVKINVFPAQFGDYSRSFTYVKNDLIFT